jgi:hypothetical protein
LIVFAERFVERRCGTCLQPSIISPPISSNQTEQKKSTVSISVSSGSGQSAAVSSPLTSNIVAVVKDGNGNALAGVTVTWAVTGGGGTLSSCATITDTNGLVHCTWTLGVAGTNAATASVSGGTAPVTFNAQSTGFSTLARSSAATPTDLT